MFTNRVVSVVVGVLLALLSAGCAGTQKPQSVEVTPRAGVQLFQWPWRSVAAECPRLAESGYAFVLLSPAQEHVAGEQWWTSYQPVSYRLESKLGTEAEFSAMVKACHDAGIKVVADAVINHMAGIDGGTGGAGTQFTHYDYPGLYTSDDFHHCGTAADDIVDYHDRAQVQACELSNLADLKTEEPRVREKIAGFLNSLLKLGVDGFRIDAAKHMPVTDIQAIVGMLDREPLIISEVLRGSGEPIQPEDYLGVGGVFAFQYARDLSSIVPGGAIGKAKDLKEGTVPSDQAYTFVANHDSERGTQTLNYTKAEQYRLATLLLLATDYGTPIVYSGYSFTDREAGPPMSNGRVEDVTCATQNQPGSWLCQHRDVATMVKWTSVVGGEPADGTVTDGENLAVTRGAKGLVAINAASEPWQVTLETKLPNGWYCDVLAESECTRDEAVEVKDGKATVTAPAKGAVALDVNHTAG